MIARSSFVVGSTSPYLDQVSLIATEMALEISVAVTGSLFRGLMCVANLAVISECFRDILVSWYSD